MATIEVLWPNPGQSDNRIQRRPLNRIAAFFAETSLRFEGRRWGPTEVRIIQSFNQVFRAEGIGLVQKVATHRSKCSNCENSLRFAEIATDQLSEELADRDNKPPENGIPAIYELAFLKSYRHLKSSETTL